MRKSIIILTALILSGGATAMSQSPSEEFNKFRQQILSDYSSFKSRILEHYEDFLNGEWHEFESIMEAESPYTEPKPEVLPAIDENNVNAMQSLVEGIILPNPYFSTAPLPVLDDTISSGDKFLPDGLKANLDTENGYLSALGSMWMMKELAKLSNYTKSTMHLPDPEFAFGNLPGQIKAPTPDEAGFVDIDMSERIAKDHKIFKFDFYGMDVYIPAVDFEIMTSVKDSRDTGIHWKKMEQQEAGAETARQLFGLADQLGLNGYLTFRLIEQYANQRFKDSDAGARMSAAHFLLSQMGYDVRLVEYDNMLTVMMPFDQSKVYGMRRLTQNNGRTYTLLYPEGYQESAAGGPTTLRTYILPSNAGGKTSDLRITGLSLPHKGKSFSISRGGLTLTGEVNENIRKMFHHYPQMPCGDFASSWIDTDLRDSLVNQVRQQLNGMPPAEAINTLLGLCHYGFDYKTDQDQHSFEKPYFVEENFLYDFNDCEDRAIFMSYLVWNALGLPCQLIQYPGHESVTVAVTEDTGGCYYNTDGVKYYSADPTYIGSVIGMIMTNYRTIPPSIDKHYK